MRKCASAALTVLFMLATSACNYLPHDSQGSLPMEGPPNPELVQYAEDITRSWNLRYTAMTWRSETDDVTSTGAIHVVAEAICPDRYHVTTSGAENWDTYYIGKMMYQRKNGGKWVSKAMPVTYQGIRFCGTVKPETIDGARIRLVAEQLRDIDLSKPVIREIAGRRCREWTRNFINGKNTFHNSNCYDLQTHELVHSVTGKTEQTFYWNIPLEIKAPI